MSECLLHIPSACIERVREQLKPLMQGAVLQGSALLTHVHDTGNADRVSRYVPLCRRCKYRRTALAYPRLPLSWRFFCTWYACVPVVITGDPKGCWRRSGCRKERSQLLPKQLPSTAKRLTASQPARTAVFVTRSRHQPGEPPAGPLCAKCAPCPFHRLNLTVTEAGLLKNCPIPRAFVVMFMLFSTRARVLHSA